MGNLLEDILEINMKNEVFLQPDGLQHCVEESPKNEMTAVEIPDLEGAVKIDAAGGSGIILL
ncbi:hypothetical protein BH11BAC7_BH11BAC7_32490 [soil metagenome]